MERIVYSDDFSTYLSNLVIILHRKRYVGFLDTAIEYVSDIYEYIEQSIHHLPNKPTPIPLQKFGDFFITYKANANTTWYVLFYKDHEKYLITHIFNSHSKEAQWFNF